MGKGQEVFAEEECYPFLEEEEACYPFQEAA